MAALVDVVEGLDTEVVASHEQRRSSGAKIANNKGKHSIEPLHALRAVFLVQMDNDFCIGVRCETMAIALELTAKFRELVYLSVVGDPDGTVLVAHGHVTGR